MNHSFGQKTEERIPKRAKLIGPGLSYVHVDTRFVELLLESRYLLYLYQQ